ncbi:MAG TPA: response regulator transcription factor [Candidatus Sulfotelmatobacter sp.]|nr:response regulator transcription factor [Candidatus Sulfotelmatobacter sp.]
MGKIRVLVASDYEMVRSGLRQLLKIDEAFDLLPTDADIGNGLPYLCQTLLPDILLIEVATNSSSTLRIPANVLASVPHMRILVLSTIENAAYVRAIFATGVLGYILKSAAQSELVQALKQVNRGRRFIDPRLYDSLSENLLGPITTHATKPTKYLSRRESEVLRSIALGFTTAQISKELRVSQKTVQTYRERIYKKLGLKTRADLVHYALAHGLIGGEN